uniref:transposase n=1 Tax=Xanthomonas axonopodis TaxID=53413 RepID=UPI002407352D
MICSSVKRFFTSNLLQVGNWTPNWRATQNRGDVDTTLDTGGGRAATEVQGARWLNVVLGNVKRAISGTYHAVRQAKYARRYLAE